MQKPVMYLAGAIRDNHPEDVSWREDVIHALGDSVSVLNPLAGKTFNKSTGVWTMNGLTSSARTIVKQDFWCVDRADIVIANLLALAEGYPSIGTMCEFGRATGKKALIYAIVPEKYTGHENGAMYKLHPFIEENSTAIFHTVDDLISFLSGHITMLNMSHPGFAGVIDEPLPKTDFEKADAAGVV